MTTPQPASAPSDQPQALRLLQMLRAMAVIVGPSLLLHLWTATGGPFRPARRRLVRVLLAPAALVLPVYLLWVRPWFRRWGAADAELDKPRPGDELVPDAVAQSTRAVTVDAPVETVWPWVAQIGQERGGFYSYEWLENLAGCEIHNADRIHPEWQQRAVGDPVYLAPASR